MERYSNTSFVDFHSEFIYLFGKHAPVLANRSKLTKRYYSNPTEENKNLLNAKSNKCSKMIVETKERCTNKLSKKLDDSSTKCRWISTKFLLISTKKWNSSIHILPLNALQITTQVYFHH